MANEETRNDSEEKFNAQTDLALIGLNGASDIETIVQAASEEYKNIDQTLDEIDTWMTKLEQQNDNLYSELEELLQSSRQARLELQQQQQQEQDLVQQQTTDSQQSEQDKNSGNS